MRSTFEEKFLKRFYLHKKIMKARTTIVVFFQGANENSS